MDNIKFVSSERLIASVLEDLSSFDANNQLDSGRWYTMIKKVVSDLGVACYKYKHALLYIDSYKDQIPCDFAIMESAFLVKDPCNESGDGIINYQGRSIIWDDTTEATVVEQGQCEGCDYRTCKLEPFKEVTVREYVKGLPQTYTYPILYPLHVNNRLSKAWCLPKSICFGSNSKQEVSVNNGELYCNFEKGIVLFNYYAYPYDENNLPEIPENPKIQLAVEHYIKWKALENIWVNNGDTSGVQQKMMYFKNEFENNSYPDAEYVVKLTSFNTSVDMARTARKSLNVYQLIQK